MSISRFQGSGRNREGGMAAVHRHDFKVHTDGTDWRHKADHTDMNPALTALGGQLSAPTVQETLEKIAAYFSVMGHGFVSIGIDGYSPGDFTVNATTTLYQAFNSAFAHDRLKNGGIILVKAGVYRLMNTVTVPTGITIMGEIAGTHIIGSMSELSMFVVRNSGDRFYQGTNGGNTYYASEPIDTTTFFNLTLSDNIDGYSKNGSNEAITTMSTTPMIKCERGCRLVCENVTFLGRVTSTATPFTCTLRAIGLDALTTAPADPSYLKCSNCYFDGMANAIYFDVENGSIDTLCVEKCKAKTLAASAGDAKLYSFVAFNLCNAHFEGNYHIGDSTAGSKACFYLTSTAVSNSDVRVAMIGNNGGLTTQSSFELNNFFKNDSTATFSSINTGNSWGLNYNNPWYITVGDGTNSVGDITGPNAINFALERSVAATGDSDKRNTTVIVGYGTYTVTDSVLGGFASYVNLYGLDRNGALPTLELNVATDTDAAGNKTLKLGPNIENIKFKPSTATSYHTVSLTYSSGSRDANSYVHNCRFEDVGIFYPSITRTSSDKIAISFDTVFFKQTGTYTDNFDFLITPAANIISLKNVYRTGKGYVGGIGQVSGISYTPTQSSECVINIESCVFTLSDGAGGSVTNGIIAASELTGKNHFFFIEHTGAQLLINNSKIMCSSEAHSNPTSVIGGGLPAAGSFKHFIRLYTYRLHIDNSKITGPDQAYTSSGTDYSMVALWARATTYAFISNTVFNAACALQVQNASWAFTISKCIFSGYGDKSTSLIDFDIASDSLMDIVIDGCSINNAMSPASTNIPIEHSNVTGANYTAIGIVQIYAQTANIKLSDSYIKGAMGTGFPSGFIVLCAVYLDTLNDMTSMTLEDANVIMIGNEVKFENSANTGSALNQSFSLVTQGRKLSVHDNTVRYISQTTGGTNTRAFMYAITDGYGNITGNMFDRYGDLSNAGVVLGGAGGGLFCDNVFTDPYVRGTTPTNLIWDISTTYGWVYERNINQTVDATVFPIQGTHAVDTKSIGYTGTSHYVYPTVSNAGFYANASATSTSCYWYADLTASLPPNTYIIRVQLPVEFNVGGGGTFGGSDRVRITIRNETDNDTSNDVTLSGGGTGTCTAYPTNQFNYRVNNTNKPMFVADVLIGNSTTGYTYAALSPVTVRYRW